MEVKDTDEGDGIADKTGEDIEGNEDEDDEEEDDSMKLSWQMLDYARNLLETPEATQVT